MKNLVWYYIVSLVLSIMSTVIAVAQPKVKDEDRASLAPITKNWFVNEQKKDTIQQSTNMAVYSGTMEKTMYNMSVEQQNTNALIKITSRRDFVITLKRPY